MHLCMYAYLCVYIYVQVHVYMHMWWVSDTGYVGHDEHGERDLDQDCR